MAKPDPKKTAEDIEDSFANLRKTLQAIGEELGINVNKITEAKKEYRSLLDIARQLQNNEEEIQKLTDKQVKNLRSKAEANLRDLKTTAQELSHKKKLTNEERALLAASKDNFSIESKIVTQIQKEDELREKINKRTGLLGITLKGISKIPILGNLLDADKALEKAQKTAREGGGRIQTLTAAFSTLGENLTSHLTDPLVIIGLIIKGFKTLLDLGFKFDTDVTNISKSMAVSKEEANGVYDNFKNISRETYITGNNVDRLYITTTNLTQAQLELAEAMGATRGFTDQQLKDQILLTKQIGLQGEEAAGVQQLALANNMTAKEVTGSVIKQTASLAKQTGIQLDNKKIVGEVAKVSGQLRLQYANNPALIAKAVVQTQKLGVSLEQAKQAAEGLLNFEQSIENELSAELLTGKALNLERARLLALNGDSAAAAEEMANQIGTAADFSKMNVIQQESLAKAVGMNADELANSLVTRENLNKLGSETRKQIEEQIELAKQQGDQDKVNMLERSIGNEAEAQAALERVSEQDKFNAGIDKLKTLLGEVLSGPAMGLAKWLGNLVSDAGTMKALFIAAGVAITGIKLGGLLAQLASAAVLQGTMAAGAISFASAITLGVGMIAVIAGIAAAMGAFSSAKSSAKKANDMLSPSTGGSGYGKRTLFGPEGAIQLNDKDTVIAGTNLFDKADDMVSSPKGSVKVASSSGGNMAEVVAAINSLKQSVNALASRPINVGIDGQKVIKATTGANPNTDGDEMRKNSYKIQ